MKPTRTAVLLFAAASVWTTVARADQSAVDLRVDRIMGQLSAADKIKLLHGVDDFFTGDVAGAGVPRTKMTDGPVGTRNDGKSTAYPAGVLLAATWDPAIAEREGTSLGRDARARGDHYLLGPGVNICRQAQNGRNFEYMGEDPYLAGRMDVGYIRGVQSQGVAACVKHYACNNQETRRGDVDVRVDERTLHEIYLPAFEAAVKQGHVRSIMASYNKVNGDWATANRYLLTDVLRTEWGFDGVAMSDWGAVHDTLGPMTAGLDLEMPDPKYFNPGKIQPLLDAGKITPAMIDEKVRHLLHVEVEMGWLDRPQLDPAINHDDPAADAVALAVAREGIVLLKNDGGLLPLDRTRAGDVVVIGPDVDRYVGGGGSSYTDPARPVTILAGLKAVAPGVNFVAMPTTDIEGEGLRTLARASVFAPGKDAGKPLAAAFFNNPDLAGEPVLERSDKVIDFNWHGNLPAPAVTNHSFSARWKGTIRPGTSGDYVFIVRSDDGSRVILDGKTIVDNWHDQAAHTESATIKLTADRSYELTVEYYNSVGDASIQFAYGPVRPTLTAEQRATIGAAGAAVVCVHTRESEGGDRAYGLPSAQRQIIDEVSAINPRTVVVLEAGGNVAMPWADHVPAIVDAWFPGQAGGRAVAEILFGDVNPSGHLPDTFEKDWPDSPAYGNYPGDAAVHYAEGIYVGYRWYDRKKIEPRFPFGHGLSYTTFGFKNLKVEPAAADACTVTVDVTNTGGRAGSAVAQLYVAPPAGGVDRPVRELKGFSRIDLVAGETKTVSFPLDRRSFAHWDVETHGWKVVPGEYGIVVGQSSRDAAVNGSVGVK